MNKVEQAQFDAVLKEKGRKAANEWAALNVTVYDVYQAHRSERVGGEMPPNARWMFRATLKVIAHLLRLHHDATRRVLSELREKDASAVFPMLDDLFYTIRVAEGGSVPSNGEFDTTTDVKRHFEATHVIIKCPEDEKSIGIYAIALDVGPHVWVHMTYMDLLPEGMVQVGDSRSPGYSIHGNRIVSVPAEWCTFLTAGEAEGIDQMRQVDEQMLANAR
jgi:hypothetical protein